MPPRLPALLGATVAVATLLLPACTSDATPGRAVASTGTGTTTGTRTGTGATGPSGPAPASSAPRTTTGGRSWSGAPARSDARSAGVPPLPPGRVTPQRVLAGMTLAQQVGQLLMVDCPSTGASAATLTAVTRDHVGSVILDGTSHLGVAGTAAVVRRVRAAAPRSAGLLVATDQEGGEVQRLQGPGFSAVPSGLAQSGIAPAALQADARTWGAQLAAAGVDVDLGPVLDTVTGDGSDNPPIGQLDRELGFTVPQITAHGLAVIAGLRQSGVAATVKHFPGLGRVTANTDLAAGVTDDTTSASGPELRPFAAAVAARVPFVMVSTAVYRRIDPTAQAAFSRRVVTGLLRDQLGFGGVVMTDDVGGAQQVAGVPVGQRAVRFVRAGGDLVLTVVADQAATMTSALLSQARRDPVFATQVRAAALRVLTAKAALGLLH